jgi:hypothetical protein
MDPSARADPDQDPGTPKWPQKRKSLGIKYVDDLAFFWRTYLKTSKSFTCISEKINFIFGAAKFVCTLL